MLSGGHDSHGVQQGEVRFTATLRGFTTRYPRYEEAGWTVPKHCGRYLTGLVTPRPTILYASEEHSLSICLRHLTHLSYEVDGRESPFNGRGINNFVPQSLHG
ncbi:hypothetical protein FOPG_05719 [Fusarium oxysporum f. sp. conglutinans race 2 54008]|uniref:Uncharacterized protein n=1 Tax=Fusarium oxysporum f. sp. conglutinans race 2 54008 TaxID=1089457 RepID=X0IAW2_FUSOX|nr:hypothetical protein FOPG_05719 [Fusarium oxysporum f. sp. conglutinans race 2 54008]EXL81056.1 hypothetical protein FOPG_05719 [Fusarium oxysporum f. sp. conglutinans race 2 54008]EXL81057.1 hypothetical protein FOPG_05719 [Fusarium oxysporum f. sp. conglutinans race 2 54008]